MIKAMTKASQGPSDGWRVGLSGLTFADSGRSVLAEDGSDGEAASPERGFRLQRVV
jgi:hypothetical protein